MTETVAIDSLDMSGRLRPADAGHIRVLAAALGEMPPVLALRRGRRLLDGFMRVDAARSLGETSVLVEWVDGDEADAWERAVSANARHGLPYSARQRREAALRLLTLAPQWSDRRVAAAVGADARSVGRWRAAEAARAGAEVPHLHSTERVGRDGRSYLSPAELEARRGVANVLLNERPELSDREVARRAGLAPATVARLRTDRRELGAPRPDRTPGASPVTHLLGALRTISRRAAALLSWLLGRR
jgi:hypothetical protein